MKTIGLPITLFSLLLLMAAPAWAQEATNPPAEDYFDQNFFQLNGGLIVGIPLGNFDGPEVSPSVGWQSSALVRVNREFPVFAGLEVGNYIYDRQRQNFDDIDIETRPAVFLMHGMVRIAPPTNFFIRPYLDGLVGFKSLHLKTKFFDLESGDNEAFESDTESRDNTFSYGLALGFEIPIVWIEDASRLSLDIRCAYFKGGSAEYYVRRDDWENFDQGDPIDVFEPVNSVTDIIMPHIGLIFNFGKSALDE